MNTWESIRNQIREHRYSLHISQAVFKDFSFDLANQQIYFLGGDPHRLTEPSSLFSVTLPLDLIESLSKGDLYLPPPIPKPSFFEQPPTNTFGNEHSGLELEWIPLLANNWQAHIPSQISKELALQQERRRVTLDGIFSYQFIPETRSFAFPYGNNFFTMVSAESYSKPTVLQAKNPSPKINPKVGGQYHNLLAYTHNKDLWVCKLDDVHEIPLTMDNLETETDQPNSTPSAILNGTPEYIIQEEFNRYTGFEWAPKTSKVQDGLERILYTRVDETYVDLVTLPKSDNPERESYRYPRAGTRNASWELRIVEFSYSDLLREDTRTIKTLKGEVCIQSLFPWAEYLVRFGWLPSGLSVWAQILDRRQKHTAVIKIPIACFSDTEGNFTLNHSETAPRIEILFEEWSDIWINVSDVYYFFDDTVSLTQLIWASESTGFRHLYLVSKSVGSLWKARSITQGTWPVLDAPIFVDTNRSLVYFSGKRDTPLEGHFYVASYAPNSDQVVQLSKPGASYTYYSDSQCSVFIEVGSSLSVPPFCKLLKPVWKSEDSLPSLVQLCYLKIPVLLKNPETCLPKQELFRFKASDGEELHGMIIRPGNITEGHRYPALVNVYGGPKIQMINNDFKYPRLSRAFLAAKMGFVVIMIDGRGSSDRGLAFEGKIRHRLGELELQDQVEGIRAITSTPLYDFVDPDRIAITGWSYGGYLSLMALIKYPNVFKVSIAGAPVTNWTLYDSAYTERYLGLTHENHLGYHQSSILNQIDKFPDNENRLLIAHGMIDENVHFAHTEALVNALVSANKPYHLQVYPTERHGFRNHRVSEHFDTLMFYWLRNYL